MAQFGPIATATWMPALTAHMDEAGASPASTLAAFIAEEAQCKAAEKAQFHEIARRVRRENGDNAETPPPQHASLLQRKVDTFMLLDVFMGHRLDATAVYLRRLEDAIQACEVRMGGHFTAVVDTNVIPLGLGLVSTPTVHCGVETAKEAPCTSDFGCPSHATCRQLEVIVCRRSMISPCTSIISTQIANNND